ncbi:MAG: FkbM family methyltransferase [Candidatus Contendobacter sp.]|nr:FkbM family methyltransferase [Candidatus Contendobacter sp.]
MMTDLTSILVIRSLVWKIGRRLYMWAKRDLSNNPKTNGEYWLIEKLLSTSSSSAVILIDIGANKGDWSAQALKILDLLGKRGEIYAFEPAQSTYEFLIKKFQNNTNVMIKKTALSNYSGEAEFFVVGALAGTNSLLKNSLEGKVFDVEKVQTLRFDDFLASAGLTSVAFVKSDTEGYDMSVLMGAQQSLREGRVEVWQFEYNYRWIANHHNLKDVFNLIEEMPYCLGKLYGNGIEIYEKWHPELDRFFEGNYVLIREGSEIKKFGIFVQFDVGNVLVPNEKIVE